MIGNLVAAAFYGVILVIIFFRVKKRSHPSRNVWLNTAILSLALMAVTILAALPFIAADVFFKLPRNDVVVGVGVGAIFGACAVVWVWLMRRFEKPKN